MKFTLPRGEIGHDQFWPITAAGSMEEWTIMYNAFISLHLFCLHQPTAKVIMFYNTNWGNLIAKMWGKLFSIHKTPSYGLSRTCQGQVNAFASTPCQSAGPLDRT